MERTCRRGRLWPAAVLCSGVGLCLALSGPLSAAAQPAAGPKSLADVLRDDSAATLRLSWSLSQGQRLEIEAGSASLIRCSEPESARCAKVGAPLLLSAGERAQLVSRLRASDLGSLASSETPQPSDRSLLLWQGSRQLGGWRLSRGDWPTPPDGQALPEFLDDLGRRIQQASEARRPIAVPQSLEELRALRLQLRLEPRRRPGGLVVIEGGKLRVQPAEGFVPRSPAPRPSVRGLSLQEEQQLLSLLTQAQLDTLEQRVEAREEPAIGDDDGRLLTLHLMPSEGSPTQLGQPRGLKRYLADLRRSPAQPLVDLCVSWLTTVPAPESPERASHRPTHRP